MGASRINIGDSRVIESREVGDGVTIRRRREASDGTRFTTYERIEKPNLAVIKKDGSRELFDRDKLAQAIRQSVGKFFASELEVEEIVSNVEDAIYNTGDSEIVSRQIGEIVLDELETKSQVAYVRFASVFHDFKTLDDFVKFWHHAKKVGGNMRVVVVYRDESEHAREVIDFLHDFERQTGHSLEVIDPDTSEGASFCKTYDIVEYPSLVALSEGGELQAMWRGVPLPTISEVSFYV